ncbi:cysteine hydrolase [Filobacillus milosensis]|uniref:Cysteine hydrolase n=1 Tax=Filobacillus milosensis TaxID=94137 RepID=A0A4Y8IIG2_9BACI|nr:isochorismatase family cysteine hydrolase [Filobacillus milosensis]TFB19608.1 cysteine hydrolase [Filobacillus milosensis]
MKNQTALVLIDLQKESHFGLDSMEKVVQNAKELIEACRASNIPIIYTKQINRTDRIGLSVGEPLKDDGTPYYYNNGTDQIEILDEIKPETDDVVIDKYRWSAFYETSLDLMLRNLGVKDLIIGGVVTDGCLMTSVFDAYFRDYNIHLVHDICSASNEGAHMSAMATMANWVYNLKVYNTPNIKRKLQGEEYDCWGAEEADSMQFTPENLREKYKSLTLERKGD